MGQIQSGWVTSNGKAAMEALFSQTCKKSKGNTGEPTSTPEAFARQEAHNRHKPNHKHNHPEHYANQK
jgi:hypothetical protein